MLASVDVSRRWLPASMQYSNWNNGLVRGTAFHPSDSTLLFYGNNGVWAVDTAFHTVCDFNTGFPKGVDNRNVRAVVCHRDTLFAATQFAIYKHIDGAWQEIAMPLTTRLSDLYSYADTLVAVGRSALYVYDNGKMQEILVEKAKGEKPRMTLFRIAYNTHSGRIFGSPGIIFMDIVGIILSVLSISGIIFFITRISKKAKPKARAKTLKTTLKWHIRIGVWAFAALILVTITGWILRPPALIALVTTKLPMIGSNPWDDKLRAIRYDPNLGEWMLSTSDGFYSMPSLQCAPSKMEGMPPVSVMGINVWEKADSATWLIGSLSGIYRWDSSTGIASDYYTGEKAPEKAGPPFGAIPIIGYAKGQPIEYYKGSDFAPMPEAFEDAPMSLWNLALEVHTGRIYTFLGSANILFIFFAGIAIAILLVTGRKLVKPKRE